MTYAEEYKIEESPFSESIFELIRDIYFDSQKLKDEDDRTSTANALYCAVSKRMGKRLYEGNAKTYLSGLINDVNEGKREFSEVCYENNHARNVFKQLNLGLTLLYSEVVSG